MQGLRMVEKHATRDGTHCMRARSVYMRIVFLNTSIYKWLFNVLLFSYFNQILFLEKFVFLNFLNLPQSRSCHVTPRK